MRKCRLKACRKELPKKKDCTDKIQAGGFCGMDCLIAHTKDKQEEKRQKDIRKATNPIKAPKKKSSQTELTQKAFNKMIRLLDEGKSCISCGSEQCGTYWDAGHFRAVGACPEIRFDPRNCYRQGSGCNRANRRPDKNNAKGAETIAQEYDARLRDRYGDELVNWLNGPHEMPRWRDDDLKALRSVFSAECRRLERGEEPSRDWRALNYDIQSLIKKL